jgi:large subunit ribosomal protein L35
LKKIKTVKAAAKRFKVTAKGKIVHSRAGHRHLLLSKNGKRKMRLSGVKSLGGAEAKRIRPLLRS